mmetsp:Transcript_5661/g.13732  ORF Transcript_5661/g.13732 Transcript_5661/m.13732 type:complete len:81 (+) Transcript_5661:1109-1351(+)
MVRREAHRGSAHALFARRLPSDGGLLWRWVSNQSVFDACRWTVINSLVVQLLQNQDDLFISVVPYFIQGCGGYSSTAWTS